MTYRVNADLPLSVQRHLPDHAQDIYREAFNHAYAARGGDKDRELRSHMVAWIAVQRHYVRDQNRWVPRNHNATESSDGRMLSGGTGTLC